MGDPSRSASLPPAGDQRTLATLITSPHWVHLMVALRLSSRERQIVESLLLGADSEAAIAKRLGISSRTVQTYIARLHEKLGVSNRTQLFRYLFAA